MPTVYKIIHLGTSAEFSGFIAMGVAMGVAIGVEAYAIFTLEGIQLSLEPRSLMLTQRNSLNSYNIVRAFPDYSSAANEIDLINSYNRMMIRETHKRIEPVCKNEFQIVKVDD